MMDHLRYWDRQAILLIGLAIGGSFTLNSCGRVNTPDRANSVASKPMNSAASKSVDATKSDVNVANTSEAQPDLTAQATSKVAVQPSQRPQLIKTAQLSLRLESIDKMMVQLRQILQSKQGDIYDF